MDELLFELLELAIVLIGKFWFVILGYLGYKVLGNLRRWTGKGVSEGKPRSIVLTPVEGGGFPRSYESDRPQDDIERIDMVEPPMQIDPYAAALTEQPEIQGSLESEQDAAQQTNGPGLDPREGMKWAIIYGPPRAKAPYAPAHLVRQQNR